MKEGYVAKIDNKVFLKSNGIAGTLEDAFIFPTPENAERFIKENLSIEHSFEILKVRRTTEMIK